MQTKQHSRINLRGNGDLIAAVPYLLGFKPSDSVVICVYAGAGRTQITLCLRADIPTQDLYFSLAEQLKLPVLRANSFGVSVIIVSDGTASPPDPLPHKDLVDALTAVFTTSGVIVHHAYWVSAIEENATWWCYSDLECNGVVPDPAASELAATAACMGTVTYDSKADIRATLEPPDPAPVAARADRIEAALARDQDETVAQQLLADLIQKVRDGVWAPDEQELVDVAVALRNMRVRDGCLRPEVTSIGRPIEEAWAELVRALPDPHRAEPACLLALTAFLRGDGVMAGVAADLALESDPQHSFANLLRTSMDYGMPPDSVAAAVAQAFIDPAEPLEPHTQRPPTADGPRPWEIHAPDPSKPHPPHTPPSTNE
ncbi:hypothetical protein ALI144C_26380 [Actinosynnema sp. ALI-1.44]|uniref:DUF4192 domain-containing protein n=1 Tax=Actinosynnema sp. ALI-1.44 TaxID=1933779 RepID=UPI00097C0E27|nr:DUF4192 domain-containing protein [Actinosynnema sp. ALI-1.44]ONI79349.1 hypothetical protein ALI144C_26380 [Actinosynnema sp. ALI-1.44]